MSGPLSASKPTATSPTVTASFNENSATVGAPPVPAAPPVSQPAPAGGGIQGNNAPAPVVSPTTGYQPGAVVGATSDVVASLPTSNLAIAFQENQQNFQNNQNFETAQTSQNNSQILQNNGLTGSSGGSPLGKAVGEKVEEVVDTATKININIHIKPAPPSNY